MLHGVVDLVWSLALGVIGLRQLLGLETRLAVIISIIGAFVVIPVQALFAR